MTVAIAGTRADELGPHWDPRLLRQDLDGLLGEAAVLDAVEHAAEHAGGVPDRLRVAARRALSHGVVVALARPDPLRGIDRAHPDLPVPDDAGPDGLGDGISHRRRLLVLDDDVNAELG
jgi:hypothetical protein